jgi:uncharacterized protein (DUF488 family)
MTEESSSSRLKIYTIGHSNHSMESFLNLLRDLRIEVIVDIRSTPKSEIVSHFNRQSLQSSISKYGIKYLYLGKELGGRPKNREYYDPSGHVLYDRIAKAPPFTNGIERLIKGIRKFRVVLLCSEENPANCHRRLLVGKVLREHGVIVEHVRGNGRVELEEELSWEEKSKNRDDSQLMLFNNKGTQEWKSIQSVLPRKVPRHSSER